MPEVIGLLQAQPELGTVAAELAQAERHFGAHRRPFGKNAVQVLARHSELLGRRRDRFADRRHHILTQDRAWMSGLSCRTPGHQLDLALDHPSLNGLLSSERLNVVTALARLILEARGIVSAATREDGDDHD